MSTDVETAIDLAREALWVAAEVSLPVLVAGLLVGLFFSALQAVSQVHEPTLAFIPKLLVMGLVLFVLAPWLLSVLSDYAREVLGRIAG